MKLSKTIDRIREGIIECSHRGFNTLVVVRDPDEKVNMNAMVVMAEGITPSTDLKNFKPNQKKTLESLLEQLASTAEMSGLELTYKVKETKVENASKK